MTEYRVFSSELVEDAYRIYEANGWKSYLGNKEQLARAFEQSLFVLGAFQEDKLVGFVRCVGDGEYILYVQDLIVDPAHVRQGIGRELMRRVSEAYPSVRQFLLITDEDDATSNAFYQAIGLVKTCNGFPVNAYFRKDYL